MLTDVSVLAMPANRQPIDASTAPTVILEDFEPHRWSLARRLGFRFAFCYFGLFCVSSLLPLIPVIGSKAGGWVGDIFSFPAPFLATNLFHVPPPGNAFHNSQGSADYALAWVTRFVEIVTSLGATAVWSALDRQRANYQTLLAWLRFSARLTLASAMATYAMMKLLPAQMPVLHIWTLSTPLGAQTPFGLLWAFLGSNRWYEMMCGSFELIACLLLLFRRTALFGALFTLAVMGNVLLYNLFFDVPVKIYASQLVLLAIFAVVPDLQSLFKFFWLHEPTAPTGVWVPPAKRLGFARATMIVEVVFAAVALQNGFATGWHLWRPAHLDVMTPCPLRGVYRIDSATMAGANGVLFNKPLVSDKQQPFVELDIDTVSHAAMRDAAGNLTYYGTKTDAQGQTIEFRWHGAHVFTYTATKPDAKHLILTPVGPDAKTAARLMLTEIEPPGGYPLMTRGFHWVNETPPRSY